MAGITLAQAETQLGLWLEADAAVANNQSYSINGRSLTRADAATISEKIDFWQAKVSILSRKGTGRGGLRYVVNAS